MYCRIVVAVLIGLFAHTGHAQWVRQYSSSIRRCIDFVDSTHGWALGEASSHLVTIDGGKTWTDHRDSSNHFITQVIFRNSAMGYYYAEGSLFSTRDGGATWQVFYNGGSPFYDQRFSVVDTSHFWLADQLKGIVRSTNSGKSWTRLDSSRTAKMSAVSFVDTMVGVAAGLDGNVVFTTDGGDSWGNAVSNTTRNVVSIAMATLDRGLFVGENGSIGQTTDGGRTWTNRSWNTEARLNRVYFADSLNAWAVGNSGVILRTTDGGVTFRQLNFPRSSAILMDVTSIGTNLVWVVDVGSGIYHSTTGGEVSRIELVANTAPTSICVGDTVTLSFLAANGVPPFTYRWKKANGQDIDARDILLGGTATDTSIVIKSDEDIRIRVVASDALNERDTLYFNVLVGKRPSMALSEPNMYCDSNEYELRCVQAQSQVVSWTCQPPDYIVGPSNTNVCRIHPTQPGSLTISLSIVDTASGCSSDTLLERVVGRSPVVYVREQPAGVLDALFDFPISRAGFRWYRVEGDSIRFLPFENKAQFYPQEPGVYGVEVTDDSSGCNRRNTYNYQTVAVRYDELDRQTLVVDAYVKEGLATIEWHNAIGGVSWGIYDLAGRIVAREQSTLESGVTQYSESALLRGLYYLVAFDARKSVTGVILVD